MGHVVFGTVIQEVKTSNIAREVCYGVHFFANAVKCELELGLNVNLYVLNVQVFLLLIVKIHFDNMCPNLGCKIILFIL